MVIGRECDGVVCGQVCRTRGAGDVHAARRLRVLDGTDAITHAGGAGQGCFQDCEILCVSILW